MDLRPSIRGFVDSPGEVGVATSMMASSVPKVVAISLNRASSWWEGAENSVMLQDWIFHTLAALYGIVAAVALVIFRPSSFFALSCVFLNEAVVDIWSRVLFYFFFWKTKLEEENYFG